MVTRTPPRNPQHMRIRANKARHQQPSYSKEIMVWANFIEGDGQKPKHISMVTESKWEKKPKPAVTVISQSNPEKAANKPVVPAMIEGQVSKNVFLDSGCECNIIDYSFLKQLSSLNRHVKFLKTESGYLSCANGSKMKIFGYTTLSVKIGIKIMKMKFAVVESMFPNVLIGIRSMKTENISIIPAWDCVKFDNHSVSFVSKTRAAHLN